MNKKAFSTVELIVSFALAMSIAVLLFQIVITLRNLYVNNGIKTELLNKQAIITNKMNATFNEKGILAITKCGSNCINFIYRDNSSDKLSIDKVNKVIEFGNYRTDLVKDSIFGDILIDTFITPVIDHTKNDSFLLIDIPITNIKVENDYGIHILYQFNSKTSLITDVIFDEDYNEYGYVVINGDSEIIQDATTPFVDTGYKVYDNNGKMIENGEEYVSIDNPFTSLTTPYAAGVYEVKYNLYDSSKNIVSTKIRKVTVYPFISNLITDGSMETGNWSTCEFTTEYAKYGSKSCKLTATASVPEILAVNSTSIALNNTHIYYGRMEGYQTSKLGNSTQIYWPIAEPSMGNVALKSAGAWQMYSFRIGRSSFTNGNYQLRLDYNNNNVAGVMYYDGAMLIDLTAVFGSGKEPSKEWCDQNIPYFDTTLKLEILP